MTTNYEKIINSSIDELVKFLNGKYSNRCYKCTGGYCDTCLKNYLQQEAE